MSSKNVNQAYSLLADRCNTMMNSKFIMSNNCISSVLKLIASIPVLTNYLIKCSQGFNFDIEYKKATATSNFTLPSQDKDKVAFVVQLLYKFDRKEIDLTKFIKVYYPAKDFEASYMLFCQNIMAPFLLAYNGIVKEEDLDAADIKSESLPVIDAAKTQVTQYITALVEIVTSDDSINDEKRENYLLMLNGFYYTFELDSSKMIKVVWTGLKSVMSSYKNGVSYMLAIEKILIAYALI